jgi:translation initiation factor IF-2
LPGPGACGKRVLSQAGRHTRPCRPATSPFWPSPFWHTSPCPLAPAFLPFAAAATDTRGEWGAPRSGGPGRADAAERREAAGPGARTESGGGRKPQAGGGGLEGGAARPGSRLTRAAAAADFHGPRQRRCGERRRGGSAPRQQCAAGPPRRHAIVHSGYRHPGRMWSAVGGPGRAGPCWARRAGKGGRAARAGRAHVGGTGQRRGGRGPGARRAARTDRPDARSSRAATVAHSRPATAARRRTPAWRNAPR